MVKNTSGDTERDELKDSRNQTKVESKIIIREGVDNRMSKSKVNRTPEQVDKAKARKLEAETRKAELEAQRIAAQQQATLKAQKISAQMLGRIAQELKRCENDTEREAIMSVHARYYHTNAAALREVVTPYLHKVTEEGKLDTRKAMLAMVQDASFESCRFDNTLLGITVSELTESDAKQFLTAMQNSKRALVNLLHSNKGTTSATQGYCYFVHSPLKNLFTDEDLDIPQFYLVSTGWTKDRSYPYYGVRMTPSDNPKNTGEIQYQHPKPITPLEVESRLLCEGQPEDVLRTAQWLMMVDAQRVTSETDTEKVHEAGAYPIDVSV